MPLRNLPGNLDHVCRKPTNVPWPGNRAGAYGRGHDDRPALDQINLVARDMDATVAFYRGLGLDIPAPFADAESGRHAEVKFATVFRWSRCMRTEAPLTLWGTAQETAARLPWSWALERIQATEDYWLVTTGPRGRRPGRSGVSGSTSTCC